MPFILDSGREKGHMEINYWGPYHPKFFEVLAISFEVLTGWPQQEVCGLTMAMSVHIILFSTVHYPPENEGKAKRHLCL